MMRCEPCSASRAAAAAPLRAAHCAAPGWRVLALGAAALLQGCVQMASSASVTSMISSASSSELISSPFRSSSRSSGEQQQEQERQQREIEGYIIVLLQRGAVAREGLYQGLAGIAGRYGISDWEAEPALWLGVGGGLAAAGLGAARAGDCAREWSAGDADRAAAVMRGYALGRERPAAVVSWGGAGGCIAGPLMIRGRSGGCREFLQLMDGSGSYESRPDSAGSNVFVSVSMLFTRA